MKCRIHKKNIEPQETCKEFKDFETNSKSKNPEDEICFWCKYSNLYVD